MPMLKLLLVEDNQELGLLIQNVLIDEGYQCIWHLNTSEISTSTIADSDIAIVDIMLPGESGLSFVDRIRKTSQLGIILLTAKSDLESKSQGFASGADDYITKPFKVEELIMRIEALSVRLSPIQCFIFEDICINSATKEITKKSEQVHLTPNEWLVIDYLIQHHQGVAQRADIIEHVRGGESMYEMSRSLDVVIAHLRKKLLPSLIITLPSVGYKIAKTSVAKKKRP